MSKHDTCLHCLLKRLIPCPLGPSPWARARSCVFLGTGFIPIGPKGAPVMPIRNFKFNVVVDPSNENTCSSKNHCSDERKFKITSFPSIFFNDSTYTLISFHPDGDLNVIVSGKRTNGLPPYWRGNAPQELWRVPSIRLFDPCDRRLWGTVWPCGGADLSQICLDFSFSFRTFLDIFVVRQLRLG